MPIEFNVPAAHQKEMESNAKIRDNIARFGDFIQPRHLEIDETRLIQERVQQACIQLGNINKLKTPKGKLNNVLNFCKVVSMMLKDSSRDGRPDGADLFFPCTIYTLLQLKKHQAEGSKSTIMLKSNLAYIRYFRQESFLNGEDDYYLNTLESIVSFVENLSENYRTDLKLREGEDLPNDFDEWSWSYEEEKSTEIDSHGKNDSNFHD